MNYWISMMNSAFVVAAMMSVLTMICAPDACAGEDAPRLPSAETQEQRDARLAWWREARFGMFIHWGPASVNGTEISWSRIGHPHDHPGLETVPPEIYDNLYKQFDPLKFDANAWMQLAKEAGMKYVVFITKHHDGFSMWPTKLRPEYSIAATPFRRDICKEIADAAHAHGLKLGWYYSTRDWTHPDYLVGDNKAYDAFYRGQLEELLTDYGRVDLLWFDHVAGNWGDYDFMSLFNTLYRLQPGILVNDRAARFIRPTEDRPAAEIEELTKGDFDTPEQKVGTFQNTRPWESCMTITDCKGGGGWSYRSDGRTRSAEECIRMLVKCVSGDGNLLLNVGPLPSGEIDPDQIAALKQVGEWLDKYGESVYGTRGGPYRNGEWGGSTYKGQTVYLHVFRRRRSTLTLPALKTRIVKAAALTGGHVEVVRSGRRLKIEMDANARAPVVTVIKLELDGQAADEMEGNRPLAVS